MKRAIRKLVENKLAEALIKGDIKAEQKIKLTYGQTGMNFSTTS
jgi:ATP-dependent Clp protease ATP-binding subunit ClpA